MSRNLVHLISQAEIVNTVRRLALELNRDYQDRSLVLVGILKGSFIFSRRFNKRTRYPA